MCPPKFSIFLIFPNFLRSYLTPEPLLFFQTVLLFLRHILQFLNLISCFMRHFFHSLLSCQHEHHCEIAIYLESQGSNLFIYFSTQFIFHEFNYSCEPNSLMYSISSQHLRQGLHKRFPILNELRNYLYPCSIVLSCLHNLVLCSHTNTDTQLFC